MKRPEISDCLTEGARLREARDAIEAQIATLEYTRQRIEVWLERARERLDKISDELAALEDALDEADDEIRDVYPERGEGPVTL